MNPKAENYQPIGRRYHQRTFLLSHSTSFMRILVWRLAHPKGMWYNSTAFCRKDWHSFDKGRHGAERRILRRSVRDSLGHASRLDRTRTDVAFCPLAVSVQANPQKGMKERTEMHTSGNMNVKHMRTYVCALAAIAASLAWAMPTKQEIKRVQPLVNELMSEHVKDYRSGRKSAKEVGDAAAGLVDKAEGEAAKFVLIRGAVYYYSVAKEFDKAADVLETIRTHISDIPPSDVNDLASMALSNAGRGGAQRLRDIQRVASEQVAAAKDIADCKAKLKKNGRDDAVLRELAAAYVRYGNWPRALKVFAVLGVKAAIYERDPEDAKGFDELKAADYWWDFKAKDPAPYKAHAADLYRKAIKKGLAEGLKEVLVKKRLAEAEALASPKAETAPEHKAAPSAAASAMKDDKNRLYCVIDLSAGPDARKYPVSYLSAEPSGGWTDEYKTNKLVLRRIEPGSFIMGWDQTNEAHRVTLTKPFYIGVFEVTQKQYELVTGEKPSKHPGEMRPLDTVTWEKLRGPAAKHDWPKVKTVASDTFIGRIRTKTRIAGFDLPTQAQWEYACRAGTTTDRYDGSDFVKNHGWSQRFMNRDKPLGRCIVNQSLQCLDEPDWAWKYRHHVDGRGGFKSATTVVGMYPPNPWGLYDMYGNVRETCLSRKYNSWGKNSTGAVEGDNRRAVCGTSWSELIGSSFSCGFVSPNYILTPGITGFRLALWLD